MVDEDRLDGVAEGAFYDGPRNRMASSTSPPYEYRIPALEGAAFTMDEGQTMRVTDVDGGQICDLVVFNRENRRERFDQGRTKANQGKILLSTGDRLVSKSNSTMMTITEDTCPDLEPPYGIHDLQWGMCNKYIFDHWDDPEYEGISEESWEERTDVSDIPDWGCWENLSEALEPWDIRPEDVPSPINFFQTMKFDLDTGETQIVPGGERTGRLRRAPRRDGLSRGHQRLPVHREAARGVHLGVSRPAGAPSRRPGPVRLQSGSCSPPFATPHTF